MPIIELLHVCERWNGFCLVLDSNQVNRLLQWRMLIGLQKGHAAAFFQITHQTWLNVRYGLLAIGWQQLKRLRDVMISKSLAQYRRLKG